MTLCTNCCRPNDVCMGLFVFTDYGVINDDVYASIKVLQVQFTNTIHYTLLLT